MIYVEKSWQSLLDQEQKLIAYSYFIDDSSEDKKVKDTKKCVIKRKLKFKNYENSLEAIQLDNKNKLFWKK